MANSQLMTRLVSRNDVKANWEEKNPILLKGEIGIEIDNNLFKIGDGVTNWVDLEYAGVSNAQIQALIDSAEDNCYSVTKESTDADDLAAIARVVSAPAKGDTCVVKELISGDKYSYTGYVHSGTEWQAMDGNYNAENVYFDEDLTYTVAIGTLAKPASNAKLDAAGKNIKQVLSSILAKEANPKATAPAVTLTVTTSDGGASGAKEVGTTVTPSYSASLSAGSYTYGPATGITATSWEVTDSEGNSSTDASGNFSEITIGDDTEYSITATAEHGQGSMPITNLGNDYEAVRIAEGSKSATATEAFSGYRSFFYGSKVTAVELNSANIRTFTNSGCAVGESQTFELTVVEGAWQIVVAFPENANKGLASVLDANAFGTDIVASFKKSTVAVEGANGYEAINYDVWVYAPETALGANTYTVTIS